MRVTLLAVGVMLALDVPPVRADAAAAARWDVTTPDLRARQEARRRRASVLLRFWADQREAQEQADYLRRYRAAGWLRAAVFPDRAVVRATAAYVYATFIDRSEYGFPAAPPWEWQAYP